MSDDRDEILRPNSWDEYIGQEAAKTLLAIRADDAFATNEAMPHTLITGSAGTGKTTLAKMIAHRLGDEPFYPFVMPMQPRILVDLLRSPQWGGGLIFLDELQSATNAFQEMLLPLMYEGYLSVNGRRIEVPFCTIIGATTDRQALLKPLESRFDLDIELDEYSSDEMAHILMGQAARLETPLSYEDAVILGAASAGVPRAGGQLVFQTRALTRHLGRPATADEVLASVRIDRDGLTQRHRRYLEVLDKLGARAGADPLARALQVKEAMVKDIERLLFRLDLITYTDRGRELTPAGYAKIRPDTAARRVRRVS